MDYFGLLVGAEGETRTPMKEPSLDPEPSVSTNSTTSAWKGGIPKTFRAGKVQKLSDGGGLYLHVTATGSKLWRMAYRFEGKQKLLSFGAYPAVSLKDARHRRDDARESLAKGIDPGEEKKQAREAVLAKEREERDTFEFVAREWFAKYEPTLSEKHAKKLRRYLENTIFPAIGGKPVTQA